MPQPSVMSTSAKRLVSRVKSSSSGYGPDFMKVVAAVDALDSNLKRVREAKKAVDAIRKKAVKDPDVAVLEGMSQYAPEQKCEFLDRALDDVEKAIKELSREYDEANASFLRMGLK